MHLDTYQLILLWVLVNFKEICIGLVVCAMVVLVMYLLLFKKGKEDVRNRVQLDD